MRSLLLSLCLTTWSTHAADSREVTVYAPFEKSTEHSVLGLHHSRPVEVDLRPYGPTASTLCRWLLRAPGANVVHRSFVAGLQQGRDVIGQTVILQLEHDEMLGFNVGRSTPDRWFFHTDPYLQAELPDLQSWNDLFGATGPLDPYLPAFFRAVIDVQHDDPRRRGPERRDPRSHHSQMVETVGKLTPKGFHVTAITMNLRVENKLDTTEYVVPAYGLISGRIVQDEVGFAIVEPFGTRFELSVFRTEGLAGPQPVDLKPFVGRWAVAQGHLDRGDRKERLTVVEGVGPSSFIRID